MNKILKFSLLLLFVTTLIFEAEAQQVYTPGIYPNPVFRTIYDRQFMTNIAVNGAMRSQMLSDSLKAGNRRGKAASGRTAVRDPLLFKATGVPVITDEELAKIGTKQEVKEFETMANMLLSDYIDEARSEGFPPNDVAYAFSSFAVKNFMVYKNVLDKYKGFKNRGVLAINEIPNYVDSQGQQAVYKQFREILKADASVVKSSDPEKEKIAGVLALTGGLTWKLYDEAIISGDQKAIEMTRLMAKQNLENFFKTPADKITIGSFGIKFN
ncbi:MAG: DUF6683 family protein [Pyrinomonadaceae bacterium]